MKAKNTIELGQAESGELNDLCIHLNNLLIEEKRIKGLRIEKELQIAVLVANTPEGTTNAEIDSFKVKVTTKLTRSLTSLEDYQAIEEQLPVKCVTMKPALDLKKVKMLEELDPSWTVDFITTKPAKAAVKLEVKLQGQS